MSLQEIVLSNHLWCHYLSVTFLKWNSYRNEAKSGSQGLGLGGRCGYRRNLGPMQLLCKEPTYVTEL